MAALSLAMVGCAANESAPDWLAGMGRSELEQVRSELHRRRARDAEALARLGGVDSRRMAAAAEAVRTAESRLAARRDQLAAVERRKHALFMETASATATRPEADWSDRFQAVLTEARQLEQLCVLAERDAERARLRLRQRQGETALSEQLTRSIGQIEQKLWQVEERLRQIGN